MKTFKAFEENLNKYYVFNVRYKDESRFMKFLGAIMFFNKGFMTDYVTTIGDTVYYPSKEWVQKHESIAMSVLAHEVVHDIQAEKFKRIPFSFLYLFPQALAPLALLSFVGFAWAPVWFFALFLLCLAPIPAPFRTNYEVEAYGMSLYISYMLMKQANIPDDEIKEKLQKSAEFYNAQFTSSMYYFMWPFGVKKRLDKKIELICSGVISDTDEMYDRVYHAYMKAVSAYEL